MFGVFSIKMLKNAFFGVFSIKNAFFGVFFHGTTFWGLVTHNHGSSIRIFLRSGIVLIAVALSFHVCLAATSNAFHDSDTLVNILPSKLVALSSSTVCLRNRVQPQVRGLRVLVTKAFFLVRLVDLLHIMNSWSTLIRTSFAFLKSSEGKDSSNAASRAAKYAPMFFVTSLPILIARIR